MSPTEIALAEKPAHVPADLVVDWNFYQPAAGDAGPHAALKRLHDGPDIVWTPRNGGHWIVTRAADIEFIQKNHDPFSMQSISLPADARPRILPIEFDPPQHAQYRTIINQFFTPSAVKDLQAEARVLAIDLIDGFKKDGRCEFSQAFAQQLPIRVFMKMVNQPLDDIDYLLGITEKTVRPRNPEDRVNAHLAMRQYLGGVIEERRRKPGTDLLSAVVDAKIAGEPISDENLLGMLTTIMFGGLDTVASTLGFAAKYLADNPARRHALIDNPGLIHNAADELLRLFAPSSTARLLTRDFQLGGVDFKAGDRVYVRTLLHGLDERKFADPLDADWERPALERNYASFGNGPHRCPGATLARSELRIFLEEWLKRIPDFDVASGEAPVYAYGMVSAIVKLPLVWDPDTVK
jgi:cytochrome P450